LIHFYKREDTMPGSVELDEEIYLRLNGSVDNSTLIQGGAASMDNLFATLIQIFLTIKVGWLTGFFKIIEPEQAKGLNIFVSKFSLPVLIYVSLATLDLTQIDWNFMIGVAVSKSVIFLGVELVELLINRPRDISRATIFAMLSTQQNDFGMGLPIISSVYGAGHHYSSLIYLVAPISLLGLNPIGFILLELEKTRGKGKDQNKCKIITKVFRGLITNPIVNMTLLGILSNFVFQRHLPDTMQKFLDAIGSAFTSLAPFTLGLSMVGKLDNIRGGNLVPIFGLLVVKSLVVPLVTVFAIQQTSLLMNGTSDPGLSNFGFLYGSIPPALGVDSYAALYNVNPSLVSASIVIMTVASAPLMYISANILKELVLEEDEFKHSLETFAYNISNISIIGVMLILSIFIASGRYKRIPHMISCSLLIFSLESGAGGMMWAKLGSDAPDWVHWLQVSLSTHGVYSGRLCVTVLSVALYYITQDRRDTLVKYQYLLVLIAPVAAALITVGLVFTGRDNSSLEAPFGIRQDVLNLVLDSLCFSILVTALANKHKEENQRKRKGTLPVYKTTCTSKSKCDDSGSELEDGKEDEREESPQMFRHTLLLILFAGALFTNLALALFRVVIYFKHATYPGLYKVLVSMDSFLWTGQGILPLCVFALDCKFILNPINNLSSWIKTKIQCGENYLPSWISFGSVGS